METRMFAVWLALASAVPGIAGDWPQWRGPNRDGKSSDTGLLSEWSAGGPRLVWKAPGVGAGYSGIAAVGERLYTMGDKEGQGWVMALQATNGQILWSAKVGAPGSPSMIGYDYPGPRCTPTVSGDLVLAADAWGDLVCVKAAAGQALWRKSYTKDFGGRPPTWGYAESPLVDDEQVVVTPGGRQGALVALNRHTGERIWQTKDFTDAAHYASIVIAEIDGVRQYVQLTASSVVGISPKDGSVLWKAARRGSVAVIPTPVVAGNEVYVTSGYSAGCHLFRITRNSGTYSVEQVYANRLMMNHHGGVVLVGEAIYGYSEGRGLTCQDLQNGEVVWSEKEKIKKGSLAYADGRLYYREEGNGTVILLEPSRTGYHEKGRFNPPERSQQKAWTHPTIAHGQLYLRDQDWVFCYDAKKP